MSTLVPYLTFRDGAASLRCARLSDLDGHEWSLGTYQPGQSW